MPFGRLGFGEIALLLIVLLIVFGPRRLPELGGALGKGIREFKRSVSDLKSEITPEEKPTNQFNQPQRVPGAIPAGEPGAAAAQAQAQAQQPETEEVRQEA